MTSMGMFIIDENEYPPSWNRASETDIIGGGGSYAIVGGRIVAGADLGTRVCGVVDCGYDFPDGLLNELKSWNAGIVFRQNPHCKTTRGKNIYLPNHIREFQYLSPKIQILAKDIINTPELLASKSFHLICSIDRAVEIVSEINTARSNVGLPPPIYIYEPLPSDCVARNFTKLTAILPHVDIFTPNLEEAAGLACEQTTELHSIANTFLKHMKSNSGVVLRCGPNGCFIKTNNNITLKLPAFHIDQSKVVDVTGGGNSFCGGFVTGYILSDFDWQVAGICGNLLSGCIIEKLGMPQLSTKDGVETWNGFSLKQRIDKYVDENPDLNIDKSQLNWVKTD